MKLKNKEVCYLYEQSMLLGTLGASLLGNLLTGGKGMMRADNGIVRAGSGSKKTT